MKIQKKLTAILLILMFFLFQYNIINAQCSGECYIKPDYYTEITTTLPFNKELSTVTVGVKNDIAYYQNDIILGNINEIKAKAGKSAKGVVINDPSLYWPNSTIPYVIEAGYTTVTINEIHNAAAHISNNTNLCVIPRTNETNYISFRLPAEPECSSPVGMQGGAQTILLHTNCGFGVAVHEILHSAGVWHEQSRSDRDKYITVHEQNILPGLKFAFDKQAGADIGPYDYASIMHYEKNAFSKGFPSLLTITTIPPGIPIGQRDGLSAGDIQTLNTIYPTPCGSQVSSCNDGIRNGNEIGVDCGGSCPNCQQQANCFDGIQNQGETGIDCGGSCPSCNGSICNYTITNKSSCKVIIHWYDGINSWTGATLAPNGNITQPFSTGNMWRAYDTNGGVFITAYETVNCSSPSGIINACNTATCNDNIQNQGETGTDCGGPCIACASCNDDIQNQNEIGIDCGGVCGTTCLPDGCNVNDGYLYDIFNGDFKAENHIISPQPGKSTTIREIDKVSLRAGKYIDLIPGFNAEYKSRFDAYIDGCGGISAPKIKDTSSPITLSNYPNPFNGETTITFELPKESKVTLFVTDMMGKTVTTLLDNKLQIEGINTITFNGSNYPQGMYYYTLQAGDNIATQKMILME